MPGWSERAFHASPAPTALVRQDAARGPVILHASRSLGDLLGTDAGALAGRALGELVELPGPGASLSRTRTLPQRTLELCRAELDDGDAVIQLHDITARTAAESSLREAVRRLEDIVDNCAALVYVKSTDGRYTLVNRQFERRFGYPRAAVIGRTDFDLFPYEAAASYVEHDRQVIATARALEVEEPATPEPIEIEERAVEVDGRWLSIKFALLDASGAPYALAGISTDITDRKRAEAALQEARDEAERANRAKSEFLSRMSHELRTPLNAILGFGQLLALEELPDSAAAGVEHILTAGGHLLALINEALDITRIEAGGETLTAVPVHACEPLQEALELVRPLARERGIELISDMHEGLHRHVLADARRLRQVLLNLLTNAIKYNREDGVVRVWFRAGEQRLRWLVTDTGPGLSPDEIERAFLPFERLGADGGPTEGTGLGLTLSKSLVEAMGGRIGVQHSAPGEGSTFFVELPRTGATPPARGAATPPQGPDDTALPPARMLYIEDDAANLELVERILARAGPIELIPAMHGDLGLTLAVEHRPDLVLLDLHLPDVAGAEVLRRLKCDERTRAIPVIVLSADATPAQIDALRTQGIADYLTKPLMIARFVDAVRDALSVR